MPRCLLCQRVELGNKPTTQNPASHSILPRNPTKRDSGPVVPCLGTGMLTKPCIWSLSSALGAFSDIVRLGGFGRRYDEGATKGSS